MSFKFNGFIIVDESDPEDILYVGPFPSLAHAVGKVPRGWNGQYAKGCSIRNLMTLEEEEVVEKSPAVYISPTSEYHTCPFKVDVCDDYSLCNCGPETEASCRADI